MTIHHEYRLADSPYIETVTRGWTEGAGSVIRPAESHWHLVLVKYQGTMQLIVTGALTLIGRGELYGRRRGAVDEAEAGDIPAQHARPNAAG